MPDVYRPLMVPLPGGPAGLSRKRVRLWALRPRLVPRPVPHRPAARRRVAEHRHMPSRAACPAPRHLRATDPWAGPVGLWPGSGLLSRQCCRAGAWVNGISGLGVSGSCGGECQAMIQRGHLDNRGPALAMTRCHAGFSRIPSRAPTSPATISVASCSERVSSRASSPSLASNWRASSCRVTLSHLPRSSSPAARGQPGSRGALAPSGIAPPGRWQHIHDTSRARARNRTAPGSISRTGEPCPRGATPPGSCRGRYHTDRQPGAWACTRRRPSSALPRRKCAGRRRDHGGGQAGVRKR
jgi:hypothetical protein